MRSKITLSIALVLGLTFSQFVSAQQFRVLSSWDNSYEPVEKILKGFLDRLEAESGGTITSRISGPETFPPFEQLDPVSRGIMDMLFTNGAYHYNDTAVAMSLDALIGGPDKLRESGIWDFADQQYQERGLKLLAVFYDMNGYAIMLQQPLDPERGLQGRRIRGTPIYHPVIEALGASPVVLPGSEIYPALERGVVDGAAWPTVGPVGMRLFEVADYMMRPSFGQVGHQLFMSLDRWNSLDQATRDLISRVTEEFELEAVLRFNDLVAAEEAFLQREGVSQTNLSSDQQQLVDAAWFEGAMDLAERQSPEAVRRIRQLAQQAGMAP
jgi:TRAP-type C4-dicarboxylate transport system substrate-binding protein